jgi:hypothetical protein
MQIDPSDELKALKGKIEAGELVEMALEYQNLIEYPPIPTSELYARACSGDQTTIQTWQSQWIAQIKANKAQFGSFKERSIGKFFELLKYKPAIIAGAGPSLKRNGAKLKDRGDVALISCLHNFHFFEDRDVNVDFYVTLDAGPVTIEEVHEGGEHEPEWYWERTKGKKLLAFIGTHPELLKRWKGEVYFFNSPVPNEAYMKEVEAIEPFHCYVSTGGNVLGACLYIAKGFMGANPICFVGADFAFSYTKRFHAWNSKYDVNLGRVVKAVDVFGNKVLTWQSYANFKSWFDQLCVEVPGIYINCTEGGTLGAYAEGNIAAIRQMKLAQFIDMYNMSRHIESQAKTPETAERKILF